MYIIGVILCINTTLSSSAYYIKFCKITDDISYYEESIYYIPSLNALGFLNVAVFIIWDITTLILYIAKLCKFLKVIHGIDDNKLKIGNRIKSILFRIIVCTLLYESGFVFSVFYVAIGEELIQNESVYRVFGHFALSMVIIIVSYSMFLMQEHNHKEYRNLLKILYPICCCKTLMMTELEEVKNLEITLDNNKDVNATENTIDTTGNDISADHGKVQHNPQMSVDSTKVESS